MDKNSTQYVWGAERIAHLITEEFVNRGHEFTLFIRPNQRIVIEDHVFLANEAVFADTHFSVSPGRGAASETGTDAAPDRAPKTVLVIGQDAWIGASVTLSGADIGEGATVVAEFAVPRYLVVAGNPVRIVGRARQKR